MSCRPFIKLTLLESCFCAELRGTLSKTPEFYWNLKTSGSGNYILPLGITYFLPEFWSGLDELAYEYPGSNF